MRQALQGMMQPEQMTQGDTLSFYTTHEQEQTPRIDNSPGVLPTQLSSNSTSVSASLGHRIILLPDVVRRLEVEKEKLRKTALKLVQQENLIPEVSDIFLCQCGSFDNEGPLVRNSHQLFKCP